MNKTLEHLMNCSDIGAVRPALVAICARFGVIAKRGKRVPSFTEE